MAHPPPTGGTEATPGFWDRVRALFGSRAAPAPPDDVRRMRDEISSLRAERDVLAADHKQVSRPALVGGTRAEVLTAVTRAETGSVRDVFDVALELVERQCGASSSILVPRSDGGLECLAHRGWTAKELPQRLRDAVRSDYVKRALAKGEVVNGFAPGLGTPDAGPVIVSPLLDSQGTVRGLLCLDDVPPAIVSAETISTFLAVAEWVAMVLHRRERERGGRVSEDSYRLSPRREWLGSRGDLGLRLLLEYERATRHGAPLALVTVQFPEWNDTSPARRRRLDRFVVRRFAHTLRPSDVLCRFGFPGCYVVVLADTNLDGARAVEQRLRRLIGHGPVEPPSRVELSSTGFDPEAPEIHDLLARLVERFRANSVLPLGARCPVLLPLSRPLGTLEDCGRRLLAEVSLATRRQWPLIVVGLHAVGEPDVEPGLLALHVEGAAADALRSTDSAYAVGPNHVALVLPHTTRDEAGAISDRLLAVLRERHPGAAYGCLGTRLLAFGEFFPDAEALLEALSLGAPLSPVAVSGC